MNSRRVMRPLILALAWSLAAANAQAFSLAGPLKAVEKLLGRDRNEAPVRPGERDSAQREAVSPEASAVPGGPAVRTMSPAEEALADSAAAQMLDEILLSPEPYYYQLEGRRDPFASLLSEEAQAERSEVNPAEIYVRGILWGERDRFALVENAEGESFILREGDRLGSLSVTRIDPDGIVVYTSEFGVGKTVRLPLAEGKGSKHARSVR